MGDRPVHEMNSSNNPGLMALFILATTSLTVVATSPSEVPRQLHGPEANSAPSELYTRTYKVDPGEFSQALGIPESLTNTNATSPIRALLIDAGMDLRPPKMIYYRDNIGLLWVRATLEELDLIESLLQVISAKPFQVNIRARFAEVPEGLLENEQLGVTARTNRIGPVTGIMTESQTSVVLKKLDETPGVEILSTPQITTLSGRQAQIQTTTVLPIFTSATPLATNGTDKSALQTTNMAFGPALSVLAHVSDDTHTVHMDLTATVTEFLGYDDPGNFGPPWEESVNPMTGESLLIPGTTPLPRIRTRRLNTTVNVWDGQTVVLGGFISESLTRYPDGSENKRPAPGLDQKQLLIFVTPTVIDQAGNRVQPGTGTR